MSVFCFFKQKTAYERRISDWSSDVCSSDLNPGHEASLRGDARAQTATTMAPPGTSAPQPGVRAEGATPNNASTGTTTTSQTASAVPQQRALGDPALLAQSRPADAARSEEHTSELQSLMRISYAVFCLKKKNNTQKKHITTTNIHQ